MVWPVENLRKTVPDYHFTYSDDERVEMVIHSIKANRVCKTERKSFNLCRANLLGRYVEPNFCLENAKSLINCYQRVRKEENAEEKERFNKAFECGKNYLSSSLGLFGCQKELNEYLG